MSGSKNLPDVRVHTGDRQMESIQRAREDVAQVVNDCPFIRGKAVRGVLFAAGVGRLVTHRLGYRPKGYLITRNYGLNVANVVGESGTIPADPNNQIWLLTTVNATVDLWFF
jgi:hypothetical protein